jgi:hypothetical protein
MIALLNVVAGLLGEADDVPLESSDGGADGRIRAWRSQLEVLAIMPTHSTRFSTSRGTNLKTSDERMTVYGPLRYFEGNMTFCQQGGHTWHAGGLELRADIHLCSGIRDQLLMFLHSLNCKNCGKRSVDLSRNR